MYDRILNSVFCNHLRNCRNAETSVRPSGVSATSIGWLLLGRIYKDCNVLVEGEI
jgi:hypothetical protein